MTEQTLSPNITAAPSTHCATCSIYNNAQLVKLGVDASGYDYVVALAGNPNTGKSTVFNALTGLRQHTGNWSGKTVARAEGGFRFRDQRYKLLDLPGTYSLLSTSTDEEVARDFLLFGRPDVTVVVLDATRLERNLNLALQVLAITDRVVIAVNLIDEAQRHGMTLDVRSLTRDLGVPVVPMAARRGQGIPELLAAIAEVASGAYLTRPRRLPLRDPSVEQAVSALVPQIEAAFPGLPNVRWVALRLIDGDASITQAVRDGTLGALAPTMALA
ncbi:FeoB small GTPase domain-containing protein [Candidatus Oscillochloris fontis]|uniref:FeoB small GTPase domain-containing protein n=1 Tax=Candidatus Oscillochloris fontis TaxID=2496868 RepID=UPI0015839543|nr:FeoB small GTPase domain-containing protein [Candidatus Oscillochloris fontis]